MERPEHLPAFYIATKALEVDKPLPWRPINTGTFNPTTPLSVVFIQLFKLIQSEAHVPWNQLVRSCIGLIMSQCPIVAGCDDVAVYIQWLNRVISCGFLDIRRLKLATSDFLNIYTNFPLRDI